MRLEKRQSTSKSPASEDDIKKLRVLEGFSVVQLGDVMYVDGGHYYTGNLTDVRPSGIYNLENDPDKADEWLPLEDMYAFDLTQAMPDSTTAGNLTKVSSTIGKKAPATRGWGGHTFADPINKGSFIHIGGLAEGGKEPDVPFWGYNPTSGYTSEYKIIDSKKAKELFNMYDGAATVSPDGKVWYLGGVDYNGNAPTDGARLAWYDMKTGEVGSNSASGGNLTVPVGANLRSSSLIYLPYGEKGVLVNIGGAIWKGQASTGAVMDRVIIYDIASSEWHTQGTTAGDSNEGTPIPRSHFCAVAPSPKANRTSYEIVFYGGYDTNSQTAPEKRAIDDFWALTIPTFQWSRYYSYGGTLGKYNRSCTLLNDYWYGFVDLGMTDGGAILSFWDVTLSGKGENLNNGGWGRFDPQDKGYQTPLKVSELTSAYNSPPAGWAPGLSGIFAKTIFDAPQTTNSSSSDSSLSAKPSSSTKTAPIVGGVIGGLAILIGVALLILFFLRRKRLASSTRPDEYFGFAELPVPPKAEAGTSELGGQSYGYSGAVGSKHDVVEMADSHPVLKPERVELYGSEPNK